MLIPMIKQYKVLEFQSSWEIFTPAMLLIRNILNSLFPPSYRKATNGIGNINGITATGLQVTSFGFYIYVVGGEFGLGRSKWNSQVWKYDILSKKWDQFIDLENPRRHHSLAHDSQESLFMIGGVGKHRVILDLVERLHGDFVETMSNLPNPMYNITAFFYDTKLYVLQDRSNCFVYENSKWTAAFKYMKFPEGLAFNSALPYKDDLYFTSKNNSTLFRCPLKNPDPMTCDTEIKETIEAEELGKFKNETQNLCLLETEGKIYNFSSDEFDHNSTIEVYDIAKKVFKLLYISKDPEIDFSPYFSFGCFPLVKYPYYNLPT